MAGTVASARADLLGAAGPFGSCLSTFAVAPAGAGAWTPLPWEESGAPGGPERAARLDGPPRDEEDDAAPSDTEGAALALGDEERAALALSDEERAAVALLDGPESLGDRLAPLHWAPAPAGRSSGRVETGALHTNRAGAVQGGVLAGLAAAAARRAAGRDGARVASFHLAYLRPAPPGGLQAAAEVLHAGRRAALVRADVTAGGAVVGLGHGGARHRMTRGERRTAPWRHCSPVTPWRTPACFTRATRRAGGSGHELGGHDLEGQLAAVAQQVDRQPSADPLGHHEALELVGALHRLPVHAHDEVLGAHARARRQGSPAPPPRPPPQWPGDGARACAAAAAAGRRRRRCRRGARGRRG